MKVKLVNIILIIAFMLMLLMPMIFINLSGGKFSERENRNLSVRPDLSLAVQHPIIFIRKFNAWFTDNVGFREQMIDLYRIFNNIESEGTYYREGEEFILIGQAGHHFYAGVEGNLIPKFYGEPFLTEDELSGLSNGLDAIKTYLDKKDIPLVVMFCADKDTLYPEYFPKTIRYSSESVQLDMITEYINTNTTVDVFNIRERLLSEKENYPIYDKTGDTFYILTHYNEIGAFFTYQELMKHISVYIPDIKILTIEDIIISYENIGTYTNIPIVTLKDKKLFKKYNDNFFDNVELRRPYVWENVAYSNKDVALPTILVMSDSYAGNDRQSFLYNYLPLHFEQTIFIHYENMEHFEDYVNEYSPDIVVFESAERALPRFSDFIRNSW